LGRFFDVQGLPRIDGDTEKLKKADHTVDVLTALLAVIEEKFEYILNDQRIDLLREEEDSTTHIRTTLMIDWRAKPKLEWMKARLELNSFTTFWP